MNTAELKCRGREGLADALAVTYIDGAARHRFARACFASELGRFLGGIEILVGRHHVSAHAEQLEHGSAPNAATAAGDEEDAAA